MVGYNNHPEIKFLYIYLQDVANKIRIFLDIEKI